MLGGAYADWRQGALGREFEDAVAAPVKAPQDAFSASLARMLSTIGSMLGVVFVNARGSPPTLHRTHTAPETTRDPLR